MGITKTDTIFLILLITNTAFSQPVDPYKPDFTDPPHIPGMALVWNDEFNADGKPDPANWRYETGFVRNEELQWYQQDNANCSGGLLVITGRRDTVQNPNYNPSSSDWKRNRQYAYYTSSCIKTVGLQQWEFGCFIIRARIDTLKGSWPAIWTLGSSNQWPSCGEIDIMEFYRIGGVPTILANFAWGTEQHWVPEWDTKTVKLENFLDNDPDWVEKFHIWCLDWNKDSLKIFLDDSLLNDALLTNTINADGSNPFLQPHYLLLNLAIGANGGNPSQTTFPITYEVDYARVYQESMPIQSGSIVNNAHTPYVITKHTNKNVLDITFTNNAGADPIRVLLYSLNGRIILMKTVYYNHSANTYRVNFDKHVKNGVYIIKLVCGRAPHFAAKIQL